MASHSSIFDELASVKDRFLPCRIFDERTNNSSGGFWLGVVIGRLRGNTGVADPSRSSGGVTMKARPILILVVTSVIWPSLAGSQLVIRTTATEIASAPTTSSAESYECNPTTPDNHDQSRNPGNGMFRSDGTFGNDSLYTILGSRITFRPGGAGAVLADGSLSMKYMWWRLRNGQLAIKGHRLDDTAPPLRASVPDGYGEVGFQATSLIFPTPGCWGVTASVDDSSISFIVDVTLIGDGPCWKEARVLGETGGTVTTTSWVEEPVPDSSAGQRVTRLSGERNYKGGTRGIRGTGTFRLTLMHESEDLATFEGYEDIAASIGSKTGGFRIRHVGNINEGIIRST
jgi:hypothetical protein